MAGTNKTRARHGSVSRHTADAETPTSPRPEAVVDQSETKLARFEFRRRCAIAAGIVIVIIWSLTATFHIGKSRPAHKPKRQVVKLRGKPHQATSSKIVDPAHSSHRYSFDPSIMQTFVANPHLSPDGRLGKEAQNMRKEFIELETSKTRASLSKTMLTNNGGCSFEGPLFTPRRAKEDEEHVLSKMISTWADQTEVLMHLEETPGAALLTLDQHNLCSWDPFVFAPSVPMLSQIDDNGKLVAELHGQDDIASAYHFKDVCVTHNIDSLKQAQRAVWFFDPMNRNDLRCSLCPNPQTTFEWSSNPCGMMWLHQGNAMSLADLASCYAASKREIRNNGQRQIPGEAMFAGKNHTMRGAIYYSEPTLLLQYTRNNPGHQLWDSLSSILTILKSRETHEVEYFSSVISHQSPDCDEDIWICSILRHLGAITTSEKRPTNMIKTFPGVLTCFADLIVPIQGWNHANDHSSRELFEWLRGVLRDGYELTKSLRTIQEAHHIVRLLAKEIDEDEENLSSLHSKVSFLFYAHDTEGEAGRRRAWVDVQQTMSDLKAEASYVTTKFVPDFAKLSVSSQARLFNYADIIVMPHGGQFGNVIFTRKNTLIIELTCGGYSHLGVGQANLPRKLQLYHIVQRPCGCDGHQDESNFSYSLESLRNIMKWAARNIQPHEYGTFFVRDQCP